MTSPINHLFQCNGWIILNKESGVSSFSPIRTIKKLIHSKIGHTGTLDPFATGVLPIAIGEATKTIQFIKNNNKEYIFSLQFGVETDTLDIEGKIIKNSDSKINYKDLENILNKFKGRITQTPPIYSAIKIQGVRAYDLARKNIEFDMKNRIVNILELDLIDFNYATQVGNFYVKCESGTYIRSLGRDIANDLGSVGHLVSLDRLSVGIFNKKDAILLDNIIELVHNKQIENYIKRIDIVLDDILAIDLCENNAIKARNGVGFHIEDIEYEEIQAKAVFKEKLISIGKIKDNYFKPIRNFNY